MVTDPKGSAYLHLPGARIIRRYHHAQFPGLNSAVHACTASTLLAELSPIKFFVETGSFYMAQDDAEVVM